MKSQKFYVYVKNIIGLKTNCENFTWSFGCLAPVASEKEYKNCKFKINLMVCQDKEVSEQCSKHKSERCFGRFHALKHGVGLCYLDKKINLPLLYCIVVAGENIDVYVGKTYYRFVKFKFMNLHSIGYILFDLVTSLLLKNGMMPIYSSAICNQDNKTTIFMAPPRTGKTIVSDRLSKKLNWKWLCEDMAITDGKYIWAAPFTNSYRHIKHNESDLIRNVSQSLSIKAELQNVVIMEKDENEGIVVSKNPSRKIFLLNNYCVGYQASPVLKAIEYLHDPTLEQIEQSEKSIIEKILSNSNCVYVRASNVDGFEKLALKFLENEEMYE